MIRVRIDDENLRYYIYCYLQSKEAIDQMMRNEYGSIQQHLEPVHISNLLIPVPDDLSKLETIILLSKEAFELKESSYASLQTGISEVKELLESVKIIQSKD